MREYAGLVSRFLAYVVDAVLVAVFTGGAALVFGVVAAIVGSEAWNLARLVVSSYLILLPAILALYCAVFWMLAGRTPGMGMLGLRVVRADGRTPGWFASFVRGLLLAYFPIGALWLLLDRRRQAVHDKIARTSVVRVVEAPTPR
ncbi:RDD family protein [Actinoplanes sp. NPDC049802]|uniref:RDD family protein n=1 Tax=Actinoplanes sp. NPDC049802 TaxID=3154742 RepID=UPI0033CAC14E